MIKKDHPPPSIDLDEMNVDDLKAMTRAELDAIPYDRKKWNCGFKGCKRITHVRDYGVHPWYFTTTLKGGPAWHPIPRNIMLCKAHNKFIDRMIDQYGSDHTFRRCLKPEAELYILK